MREVRYTVQMTAGLTTSPPGIVRTTLSWVILLGLGVLGFWYLTTILKNDLSEFPVLLTTALLGVVSVLLWSEIDASNVGNKWAWRLIPYSFCLLMYSTVVGPASKLMRYPTPEHRHQFGSRTIGLFFLIFAWSLIMPVRGSQTTNIRLRKFQLALTVAAASVQLVFGFRFLRELWSATSIDQVRTSMSVLIYLGLALYLFLVAKILLPKTVSDTGALLAEEQSKRSRIEHS